MTDDSNELLRQFLSGEFNQDWDLISTSVEGVVEEYVTAHSECERHALADALSTLAGTWDRTHADEQRLFDDWGCYYLPSADGLTVGDWLRMLTDRIRPSRHTTG